MDIREDETLDDLQLKGLQLIQKKIHGYHAFGVAKSLSDHDRISPGIQIRIRISQNDPPVSEARTAAYYKKRPCAELVAIAARILSERLPE